MSNNSNASSGGIGFCGLLTIVFITLKLTDVIDWSWWYVLMPAYLPIAVALTVLGFGGIVMLLTARKRN